MKSIFMFSLVSLLLLSGCAKQEEYVSMRGLCFVEEGGAVLLIEEERGEPIVLHNRSEQDDLFEGLSCGDRIEVLTDGAIRETYPAGMNAYGCTLLEEGAPSDLPEETLAALAELHYVPRDEE